MNLKMGKRKMKNSEFIKNLRNIAIPVALQNLVLSSVNLADVFMVGKLGEAPLAALGLANQIMFLMILLLFGINSGAGVFVSQFWGDKNIRAIQKVLGIALASALASSGFFWILTQTIPHHLIRVYSPDTEVIDIGSRYLRIVGWSYVATAVTFVFNIQSRNIERAKVGLYSSIMTLLVNVSLNYLLIFGRFGFPALGVEGAAIATLIARLLECIFVVTFIYVRRSPLRAHHSVMFSWDKEFLRRYRRTTTPVLLNEMIWAVGITSYSMIYARMSTTAIAVVNIVGSVEKIIFSGFIGVANATAVMVGKKIGEKREDLAVTYAYRLGGLSFILGAMGSVILFVIARPIINIYEIGEDVKVLVRYTMYTLCFFLPFKSFNATNVVGILRAGGDTKYCLIMDVAALWLVGIPLSFIGGLKMGLPIFIVFALAMSEEFLKFGVGVRRVLSRKWVRNLTEEFREFPS